LRRKVNSHPLGFDDHGSPVELVHLDDDTPGGATVLLEVSIGTISRWLRIGFITGEQLTPGAPWRIRLDEAVRSKVTDKAPEGWLSLHEAAKKLGVTRQTVLHKVQGGELAAVHVHHGRRGSLRIQVEPAQAGLFA
jgi:excisionase family DNA binding protein